MSVAVTEVRAWLRDVIVGLDLCPFAAGPLRRGRVRLAESEATELEAVLLDVMREAQLLVDDDTVETTLLLLPHALADFEDHLEATFLAEDLLAASGLEGTVQLVGFHPDYCFEGADPADPANATNRSPVPLLHLLRTESVSRAIDTHPDVNGIAARNVALLRARAEGRSS